MQRMSQYLLRNWCIRTVPILVLTAVSSPVCATELATASTSVGLADHSIDTGFLTQFVVGLAIVLLTVIALAWFLRRFGRLQSSADGTMQLIGGLALSTRERIVLVQVGKAQILLGVAPGRVDAIHVLDEPIENNKQHAPTESEFARRLKDVIWSHKAP